MAEREFWYSPQLAINLLSKRTDPRFGMQNFTVANVDLSKPDTKLFELPDGFKVVNLRESAAPETD